MRDIPAGETRTYGEIALTVRSSPRALGNACDRNPLPIVVPCHRIVAANGALGGYSGPSNAQTKRFLLTLESAHGGTPDPRTALVSWVTKIGLGRRGGFRGGDSTISLSRNILSGTSTATVHYFEQNGYCAKDDPAHGAAAVAHEPARSAKADRFRQTLDGFVKGRISFARRLSEDHPNLNAKIIADIVSFWLSDSLDSADRALARRDWWYAGGSAVDDEIRARFGDLIAPACARELMDWQDTPDGGLALILLLDQFTRNIGRGTIEAYAGDPCAFEIVNQMIDKRLDRALDPVARIWLYHPFHHSEEIAEQDRGLCLLRDLRQEAEPAWHAYVERSIEGWTRHRDIIARFGRFPHRNAVLGRHSAEEERAHMATGGKSFGQGMQATSAAD